MEGGEEVPLDEESTDMQVRIRHSIIAFFALIRHPSRLEITLLKITAFLDFQILHLKNANLCFVSDYGLLEFYADFE